MKFEPYRKLLTRNFAPGVPHFYRDPLRNALQEKELGVASRLHYTQPWEELAEDPFRGLRAGPADFSPSCFRVCKTDPKARTSADGVPDASEDTNPSTHP